VLLYLRAGSAAWQGIIKPSFSCEYYYLKEVASFVKKNKSFIPVELVKSRDSPLWSFRA
jgi:hypothetical protein